MAAASINRRLYHRIVMAITVLWLLVVLGVGLVVKKETDEVFDSSLQELSQRVLALARLQIEQSDRPEEKWLQPVEHDEYLTYQVFDDRGRLRLRSHDAPAEPFGAPYTPGFHDVAGRRFYVDASSDQRYLIQVTEPAGHRRHTIVHVAEFLLLPLLLLWPLCIGLIYLSVREARTSFAMFSAKIAERRSADLRPIDKDKLPIEFHPVSDAVNELMARLKQALEAERSLAANSAHELRTPIASAISQLDLLRSTDLPAPAMRRVDAALEKLRGLQTTAVKLLQLTRAESGVALNMQPVNLTQILDIFAGDLQHQTMAIYRFKLPGQPVWVRGDLDAIGIAVQNLLENAAKYATAGTDIEVELRDDGVLSIRNDCDPISPDRLGQLPRRFVRASQNSSGSGIGLAIVTTIAAHCSAHLKLVSPCFATGRGFAVSLAFQLAPKVGAGTPCHRPDEPYA